MVVEVAIRLLDVVVVDSVSDFAGKAVEWGLTLCGVVLRSWGGHKGKLIPVCESF